MRQQQCKTDKQQLLFVTKLEAVERSLSKIEGHILYCRINVIFP